MPGSINAKSNKRFGFLIFACVLLWTVTTGSKNVFTAEIVELTGIFGVAKNQLSLAMTYYFITYGSLQILLYFIMPKINIKWYVLITLGLSGLVTVVIAFATKVSDFWWILSINGLLQAGLWGMCIGSLRKYLPDFLVPKALTCMSIGTALAGIVSYSSGAIAVAINFWNLPFIVLGTILSISAVVYFIAMQICAKHDDKETVTYENVPIKPVENDVLNLDNKLKRVLFLITTFSISIAIHFLFYGVQNWIPNLLTEIYGKSSSFGILVSVLAPLATTFGPIMAVRHTSKRKNYLNVTIVYSCITGVLSILIFLLFNKGLILALILLLVYLFLTHAYVTIVTSVLSFKVGNYINSGAYSSLMNAAGSFSAGFSPMLMALVIDGAGWNKYYLIICIISVAVTITTLSVVTFVNVKNKLKPKN